MEKELGGRGDSDHIDNDGHNRRRVWNRFLVFVEAVLENTARRIVAAVPKQISGVNISPKSPWSDRHVRTYSGFVGSYFIGDYRHYEILRAALRKAGLDDRIPYFSTTPDRVERASVFKGSYDGIFN